MNIHNFTYIIPLLVLFFGCPDVCTYEFNYECQDINACNYSETEGPCPAYLHSEELCEYFDCNGECGGESVEAVVDSFQINIIAIIQPWDIPSLDPATDGQNYFGVSSDASDDYDSMDIPEPPSGGCTNCINAYFSHAEWDSSFGDNFTQEYKSNLFCSSKEWNLDVIATCGGSTQLLFDYETIPSEVSVEVFYDDSSLVITDSSTINFNLTPNSSKEFLIKVSIN